uniref:Uncharacterized protein n=1 Tax=Aegilops tauschii subsp. strangulata TaxID=200361 RepID=A0A453ITY8_AEGTS
AELQCGLPRKPTIDPKPSWYRFSPSAHHTPSSLQSPPSLINPDCSCLSLPPTPPPRPGRGPSPIQSNHLLVLRFLPLSDRRPPPPTRARASLRGQVTVNSCPPSLDYRGIAGCFPFKPRLFRPSVPQDPHKSRRDLGERGSLSQRINPYSC